MLLSLSPRLKTTLALALESAPLDAPEAELGQYVAFSVTVILYFSSLAITNFPLLSSSDLIRFIT